MHGVEQLEVIEVCDRTTGTTSTWDTKALLSSSAPKRRDWYPSKIAATSTASCRRTDAMKAGQWKADRDPFALESSAPGIFAVGDVRSGSVKRVAASVGEGGVAIALVHRYLQLS